MLIREANHELDKFPPIVANLQELQRRKDLKHEIEMHKQGNNCVRREIRDKMSNRYDIVEVPRNITVNDLCLSFVINLSLTNGSGFYLATSKESLPELRKVVIRKKDTKEFIDDFGKAKGWYYLQY
ncbi:hypothetical protein KUTeg_023562 [Tegillarca granosa]|uniref:Uncharacterized protein n=1 Tax=Tegillarca granosa TaxID=220873 RepID=A0ABQ9E7G8_TEGGR|nr:hypothetical protein KUTeg_023562 [Tegillarca granosa]